MDALKNFAYSLVATAPSPATSGTTLVVTAGQGTYFPATPFDATIWPAGSQPTNANAEIVRVTNVATDTFTITRAQYGTTAQSIAVGYQIAQTVDANLLNQLAPLSGATFTGEVVVPDLKITGLTGATASSSRLVGTTTSGPPVSGTFAVGDMVIDQTATIWFCTTAGTPGTWVNVVPNSLVVRSATATAGTGEFTIFGTTGTSGQTITLPATAVNGSIYQIKNLSPYTVNILGGTNSISVSGTVYGAATPYTIPLNAAYTFVYSGGVWFCFTTTDINKMGGLPLAVTGGGTGLSTIGTAGQSLVVNSGATGLQYANTGAGPVVLYSASGTALPNETSLSTNTSGITITLPTAPPNGTVNTIGSANSSAGLSIARGGTDTITYVASGNATTGATSISTTILGVKRFVYNTGVWTEISAAFASDIVGTVPTNSGGTGANTVAGARGTLGITPAAVFPTAHNVKAWTFDPAVTFAGYNFTPTKGVAYATRIHLTTGATIATIGFACAGVGAGIANSYVSLYDSAGNVRGYGALPSLVANTYQTVTLTAVTGLALSADTDYFVVFQIGTSTTTAPTFNVVGDSSGNGTANAAAIMNFNQTPTANTLTGRTSNWGTTLNTTPATVTGFTPTFNAYQFFATLN